MTTITTFSRLLLTVSEERRCHSPPGTSRSSLVARLLANGSGARAVELPRSPRGPIWLDPRQPEGAWSEKRGSPVHHPCVLTHCSQAFEKQVSICLKSKLPLLRCLWYWEWNHCRSQKWSGWSFHTARQNFSACQAVVDALFLHDKVVITIPTLPLHCQLPLGWWAAVQGMKALQTCCPWITCPVQDAKQAGLFIPSWTNPSPVRQWSWRAQPSRQGFREMHYCNALPFFSNGNVR